MKINKQRLLLLSLALLLILGGCTGDPGGSNPDPAGAAASGASLKEPVKKSYYIFDTIVQIKVYDSRITERHFEEIGELLNKIDAEMSRTNTESELYAVNMQAGIKPVRVSENTFKVISKAADYTELTGGRFNLAIGPLVNLWDIGSEGARVPASSEINKRMPLIDYRQLQLDPETRKVYLKKKEMVLDLGGIAKGYSADVIAEYLTAHGFQSAIIDLGGNVLALGHKPGGQKWTIGIQDPDEARGNPIGSLKVENRTIVTSGVYERYFVQDGKAYHHILDSDTGYPVDNGLNSVTIVTERSIDADALSTALFSMGLEKGLAFAEQLEHVEALFITKDKKVHITPGLAEILEMTNDSYTLVEP